MERFGAKTEIRWESRHSLRGIPHIKCSGFNPEAAKDCFIRWIYGVDTYVSMSASVTSVWWVNKVMLMKWPDFLREFQKQPGCAFAPWVGLIGQAPDTTPTAFPHLAEEVAVNTTEYNQRTQLRQRCRTRYSSSGWEKIWPSGFSQWSAVAERISSWRLNTKAVGPILPPSVNFPTDSPLLVVAHFIKMTQTAISLKMEVESKGQNNEPETVLTKLMRPTNLI